MQKLGWVLTFQDLERHGQGETGNRSRGWPGPCRARAYMDVLTASPGKLIPIAASPPVQIMERMASQFKLVNPEAYVREATPLG
jgi:hypothetical protein